MQKCNAFCMHVDDVDHRTYCTYLPCAAKSWSLPLSEKMSSATSASQSTASSRAFFASPRRRFEKVTCRLTMFSIRRTSTLPRPRPIDLLRSHSSRPAAMDGRPELERRLKETRTTNKPPRPSAPVLAKACYL